MNWKKRIAALEEACRGRHQICPLCKQGFDDCKHSRADLHRALETAKIEYIIEKREKRMKTLSEYESEKKASEDSFWQERLDRYRRWLSEIENIPLYEEKDPTSHYSPAQVGRQRDHMRELIREGQTSKMGVACDNCGTELVNRQPGTMTLSIPPKYYVGCPGCGWIGWKRA